MALIDTVPTVLIRPHAGVLAQPVSFGELSDNYWQMEDLSVPQLALGDAIAARHRPNQHRYQC